MKRLFVCEFITCGGMRDRELATSLYADAECMYQALLSDLRQIDYLEIITCRDDRLSPVSESIANIAQKDDIWQVWKSCMEMADLAWLIAPETDGVLAKLNKMARECGCELIACDDDAVELTTSKHATNQYLNRHGVPALVSGRLSDELLPGDSGWIVKPDDGAGSEECYFFQNSEEYSLWKKQISNKDKYIQQRYVSGLAASMSVLYGHDDTVLLSCNRQVVKIDKGMLISKDIIVNDLSRYHTQLETLAIKIGNVIPGLHAYVGIDLLLTRSGPVVIEINPRLTTSYAGLSSILHTNIAEMILIAQHEECPELFKDIRHSVAAQVGF